jgi:lipopolysaccharide/colanic/teichoic acid biosynthesis glycosyltransferase
MQNAHPVTTEGIATEGRQGMPRVVDVALAVVALIITAPILFACAGAVAISSRGPILFRQTRVGQRGRLFTLYKFRTMRQWDSGRPITAAGDPRITRIGKLLRKTKLDELPEFWNVLKGDMALVGARPEVPLYVDLEDSRWRMILFTRPGLTGPVTARLRSEERLLARVSGDTEQWYREILLPFKLNGYLNYLAKRSPWTDLAVLLDTFAAMLGAGTDALLLYRRRWHIAADSIVMALAFSLAYLLRFDFSIPKSEVPIFWSQLPFVVLLQLAALIVSGVYRSFWRYVSISDLKSFLLAWLASGSTLLATRLLLTTRFQSWRVPLSVLVIDAGFAFSGLIATRVIRRIIYERLEKNKHCEAVRPGRTRVLLVGAGHCGRAMIREIQFSASTDVDIKGFVDDDPKKIHAIIQGVRVLGSTEELPLLVHELAINTVVLTTRPKSRSQLLTILKICERIPVKTKIIPDVRDLIDDRVDAVGMRDLEIPNTIWASAAGEP